MKRTKWFERTFDFNFPVGIFPCIIERLRGTPARLEELVASLSPDILATRIGDAWSIKEQVGHLSDLDELHEGRLEDYRQGLAELRPADLQNRKTFEANHNAAPVEQLLASFRAARRSFVAALEEMDEATLSRSAIHPRLQQPMRVVDVALFVAEHDDHHLASITEISKALRR